MLRQLRDRRHWHWSTWVCRPASSPGRGVRAHFRIAETGTGTAHRRPFRSKRRHQCPPCADARRRRFHRQALPPGGSAPGTRPPDPVRAGPSRRYGRRPPEPDRHQPGHAEAACAARAVRRLPFPVLIEGESGSGKEIVARCLHYATSRRHQPFLALNCAAISPSLVEPTLFGHAKGAFTGAAGAKAGYFEDAGEGTLFLDEIGELPPELQAKLLRVLKTANTSAWAKRRPAARGHAS